MSVGDNRSSDSRTAFCGSVHYSRSGSCVKTKLTSASHAVYGSDFTYDKVNEIISVIMRTGKDGTIKISWTGSGTTAELI